MTTTNPDDFYGDERPWLSKAKFAELLDQYIANPKSSDKNTNSQIKKPKGGEKTVIALDMYIDMKRILKVSVT